MKPILLALCALVGGACSHGGNVPTGAPYCSTSPSVHLCADGGKRQGMLCATCDDANLTLSCQVDTGADYLLAICVRSCDACAPGNGYSAPESPKADWKSSPGVHLCSPARYGESTWCATCDDDNATETTQACDSDGFCNPLTCVRTCDACELAPPTSPTPLSRPGATLENARPTP